MKKPKIHYVHEYIVNPNEPLSVAVVGGGGTGSNIMSNLACINKSLIAIGHLGLNVTLWDDDIVTEANVARQLFYEADIGQYKSQVLINRINRAFGTKWIAMSKKYNKATKESKITNITISCVDTIKSRMGINEVLKSSPKTSYIEDTQKPYYWIDCGNGNDFGQVVIGNIVIIHQPKSSKYETVSMLKQPQHYFQGIKEDKNQASCSLADALDKQDLFICKAIALYASNILWKMIKEMRLDHQGIYINLGNYLTNSIKL